MCRAVGISQRKATKANLYQRSKLLRIGHTQTTFTFATAANGALTTSGKMTKMGIASILMSVCLAAAVTAYDPKDESLKDILLPEGQFEAFYLKGPQSEEENAARPPHLHGSFNKYRNPALVGAPNSAAYGFRFDGKRRFNYD